MIICRIRDIATIVGETVPACQVAFANGASPDKRNYRVDCSMLGQTVPQFKPQWNARRGTLELYQTYMKYGVTLEEFEGVRYQRIGHIKDLIKNGQLTTSLRWNN